MYVYRFQITTTADMRKAVREINSHLASMSGYCYVDLPCNGARLRITRAKTVHGALYGRALGPMAWTLMPSGTHVELM